MSFRIVRKEELRPQKWSGGATTELFIMPNSSSYKEMNFDLRLSTATVEVQESIYTPLKGVTRNLMVLEGELRLNHVGHHVSHLQPYDQDVFQGDWETNSYGVVKNFNLMTRNSCNAVLCKVELLEGANYAVKGNSVYYLHKGKVQIEGVGIKEGDVLIMEAQKNASIKIEGVSNAILIECSIIS